MKYNLGRKESDYYSCEPIGSGSGKKKEQIIYPSVYLSKTDLPIELKDSGKEIIAVCTFKVADVSIRADKKGKQKNIELELHTMELKNAKDQIVKALKGGK